MNERKDKFVKETDMQSNPTKIKLETRATKVQSIPPLEHAYNGYTHEDKQQALIKFTQQAGAHFPEILDSDRDKAAAKIHIENIEEQLNRAKQDSQVIMNALQGLSKIGEKKSDDMMACALLDYIDEIVEMISPRQ